MFKKTLEEVVRQLDIPKEEQELIIHAHKGWKCQARPGKILNYYELYNLEASKRVYQDGKEKTIFTMNPFKFAEVVICTYWENNRTVVHEFGPYAFSQTLELQRKEDIKENFDLFNVFLVDGTKVTRFEELEDQSEFFATSKDTFFGETQSGWAPSEHAIHMNLCWRKLCWRPACLKRD